MERKKSGLLRYMMSFGGRGGVLSNPDLYLANLSTTAITAYWSPGADSYNADIATDAAFTNIVGSYTGTATSNTFTGLTADTQYYVRVRGTKSSVTSGYETENAVTLPSLVAAYLPAGLPYGASPTSNDYATAELSFVNVLKSFVGGGPDLTRNGTGVARKHTPVDRPYSLVQISGISYMDFASAINLGTGAFTIIIKDFLALSIGGAAQMFSDSVGGERIRITSNTQILVRITTSLSVAMTWPVAYTLGSLADMVIECDGTNIRASLDGGTTWTNSVTRPNAGQVFQFTRVGASNLPGNYLGFDFSAMFFATSVLTSNQRSRLINWMRGNDWTNTGVDFTKSLKSLPSTFIADPVNGYINDYTGGLLLKGHGYSLSKNVFSWGKNYSLLVQKNIAAPDYSDATLFFGNTDTNKVRTGIFLGRYNNVSDVHHVPSMTAIGDQIVLTQFNRHYGANEGSNLFVRKSWKDFDLTGLMQLPRNKEVSQQYFLSDNQYPQACAIGNLSAVISQRRDPSSTLPGRVQCSLSNDGLASFYDHFSVVNTNTTNNWMYPHVVYNANRSEVVILLEHVLAGIIPVRVLGITAVYTIDFITYRNLANTWSKNVKTSGAITLAELYANCVILDAQALTSTMISHSYITDTGMVYGVVGNGSNTGYSLFYQTIGGALTTKTITFGGDTVVTGTQTTTTGTFQNAYHRSPIVAVYDGSNNWRVIAAQVNGGNWLPTVYQSTNNGDTWSKLGTIAGIDTGGQHVEFEISQNIHFNAGVGVFACNRALSATSGRAFVKDLASLL